MVKCKVRGAGDIGGEICTCYNRTHFLDGHV